MRTAVILLLLHFYHHTCTGQSTATASVSVTIQPLDDMAYVQNVLDELLTWKVQSKTAAEIEGKANKIEQVFEQNAVITSFEVGAAHAYSVSLPQGAITIQKLRGPETLRFSAFQLAAPQISEKNMLANAAVEATIEWGVSPVAGIYVSQTDLEITVHFN